MFVRHVPDYIASLLTPASDIPSQSSLCSSSNCDLVVPRTSRKIGDRAFSVAAPRAWNRLLTNFKLLHLTASFKSKLKSFLFHAAYTGNTVWTLECAISLIVGGALQVTVVTVTVDPLLVSFALRCHIIIIITETISISQTKSINCGCMSACSLFSQLPSPLSQEANPHCYHPVEGSKLRWTRKKENDLLYGYC